MKPIYWNLANHVPCGSITLVAGNDQCNTSQFTEKVFGLGKASEWSKCFEICCDDNGWENDKMYIVILKLPTFLEGEALALWLELMVDEQKDYAMTEKKLINGNAVKPMSFIFWMTL